jgi:Holliday junction resolvase RusA-like endonuclease
MIYPITPTPKPRMTRRDKWAKRPAVLRYRAFCDQVRVVMRDTDLDHWLTFHVPMPKSWSTKKRLAMAGLSHRQKPDIDNLVKAVFDALLDDDSGVSEVHARKVWADQGAIETGKWPCDQ